jgi:tagatose-1,6-bisphosphate aldolase non-catalytic subunit AgaZ/GatZ
VKLSVEVTAAEKQKLAEEARRLNVSAEELAAAAVHDLLGQRDADFERAATRVLDKEPGTLPSVGVVRYLTLAEVLELHRRVMEQAGGSPAVRDLGGLISAVAQPRVTFEGHDLHLTAADKAAALCVSIIVNHPFVDGNKRELQHGLLDTTSFDGFPPVSPAPGFTIPNIGT